MDSTTIAKWGNSFAVRIPKAVMERARFCEGDSLELALANDGSLVLRPLRRPATLDELVSAITPENRPAETPWGEARGGEAW